MNGFSVIIGNNEKCDLNNVEFNYFSIPNHIYTKKRHHLVIYSNGKFEKDQILIQTNDHTLVLSGVVLNLNLFTTYANWGEYFLKQFLKFEGEFLRKLRGSFVGFLFYKKTNCIKIFNDHLGTKQLFLYRCDKYIISSTCMYDVYSFKNKLKIPYNFSSSAFTNLLSFGYTLNNQTICSSISSIVPGSVAKISNENLSFSRYYDLREVISKTVNKPDLDEIDASFRVAVELQFDKDIDYGYKHLVGLSGGLDSRMTSIVAHELGYVDQLNFTFSQSNYLDETIAKKIASDYKHNWLFKSLDNGLFLKNIDEVTRFTGGNVLYYGLAHGDSFYKLLNFNDYGILHTGQLGDIILGSILKSLDSKHVKRQHGAYSDRLLNKDDLDVVYESLEDFEIELFYRRGVYGANSGLIAIQQYTETMSPFYDVDFIELCLSIPIKERINHSLYKKWILQKYPFAAKYVWEKTNLAISKKQIEISFKGTTVPLNKLPKLLINKLFNLKLGYSESMNPMQYWYDSNIELRKYLDKYFEEYIHLIEDDDLYRNTFSLYKQGNAIEKNQVLSVLSALKLFYSQC